MGDLVPEKRLNRLGQWVTKRIRRNSRPPTATPVPSPAPPAERPPKLHGDALRVQLRGWEEQLDPREMAALTEVAVHADARLIPEDFWPLSLARAYMVLRTSPDLGKPLDKKQAAEAAAVFVNLPSRPATTENVRQTADFVRAGIPAELAVEVLRDGGSLQQAEALRDGLLPPSLSSGAL